MVFLAKKKWKHSQKLVQENKAESIWPTGNVKEVWDLFWSQTLFSATEQLSCTLQGHDINAQQAMSAALMTKMFFQRQCSDSAFTVFYDTVVKEAQQFTNELVLPRRK